MAVLSFREATEITFEAQRADNLHLRAEVDALKADLAQLRELYQDRDGDLAFEFERANALEAQNERLGAENERLTDDGVQYEHVQPNGKPVLIAENERLRAEVARLTAAQSHPAILRGPCSGNGGCDDPPDEDDGCSSAEASELAIVRRVYADCTHRHAAPATDGKSDGAVGTVYTIRAREHKHVLRT
jgi:hypothetical protein